LITPPDAPEGDQHSYFTYCIRVPRRDALAHYLLKNNIYTTLRYHPLHLNSLYGQTDVHLPNCEVLNTDALSIPIHPRISDEDMTNIITAVREFYK